MVRAVMKFKYLIFCLFFVLSACSGSQSLMPFSVSKPYYKISKPIQCVPYARDISGIPIRGDAHTWWRQAQGRYTTSSVPKVGAVVVLSKTSRLKYGHVAVVKRIIDSRTIEVAHSNWGGDHKTRAVIYKAMPVKDVSANNDWSRLRFWHYPSGTFGSVYPTSGFIYAPPKVASSH